MHQKFAPLLLPLLLVGCAGTGSSSASVSENRLSRLSPAAMEQVLEARKARDLAEYELARTAARIQETRNELDRAESALKLARAGLEDVNLRLGIAEESGQPMEAAAIREEQARSTTELDGRKALVAVRKLEHEQARAARSLAEATFASRRVAAELAESEAGESEPSGRTRELRTRLRELQTEAGHLRVTAQAVESELAEAVADYEAASRRASEQRR